MKTHQQIRAWFSCAIILKILYILIKKKINHLRILIDIVTCGCFTAFLLNENNIEACVDGFCDRFVRVFIAVFSNREVAFNWREIAIKQTQREIESDGGMDGNNNYCMHVLTMIARILKSMPRQQLRLSSILTFNMQMRLCWFYVKLDRSVLKWGYVGFTASWPHWPLNLSKIWQIH